MMKRFFHTIPDSIPAMKRLLLDILLLAAVTTAWAAPIGTWKAYMAYYEVKDVKQGGNILYVLASNGLYTYNTADNSIRTYDKVNGMSDCIIKYIDWCTAAKSLVVIYDNGNIDILDANENIVNISDYMNKSMTEDKTIHGIDIDGKYAYLSTGFGVIKVNVANAEISDTYKLGFRVDYCYTEGGKIYAASSTKGIYSADMKTNLLDPANWTYTKPYVGKDKSPDPELLDKVKTLNPGGPKNNLFGYMKFLNGRLYTCTGSDWEKGYKGYIQILGNDNWDVYDTEKLKEQTGIDFMDVMCIDVNPKNENIVAAGTRSGVYVFEDGKLYKHYNQENSPIESATEDKNPNYNLITGIKYDKNGNLWIFNSGAPTQSIIELSNDETFKEHKKQELMVLNGNSGRKIKNVISDDKNNLLWFVIEETHPSTFCYDYANDKIYEYNNFVNQDGTTLGVHYVRCVCKDNENNMLVGTDVGLFFLPPEYVNDPSRGYYQVKVPRNDGTNFADYLLNGVDIKSIAIDKSNRKWIGTNGSGVYLISKDNMEQLQHFTTKNSPINSDIIESISINDDTGEVFFGSNQGLCSYMSDATTPNDDMNKDNVYAYPNPVKPDYDGLITVIGLSNDADIKITTSNGVLVNRGRSNGGMYTWDGCDLEGKRVASGVYMVQTATSDGSKGTVCKIAIIQ